MLRLIFTRYYLFLANSLQKNLLKQAVALISVSSVPFFITLLITRILSIYHPEIGVIVTDGLHIHHFNFGMVIIEICALYGILQMQGRKQRFVWAIISGVGQALLHDEQSMILWLSDHDDARWSTTGIYIWIVENAIILGVTLAILAIQRYANRKKLAEVVEPSAAD